MKEAEGAEAGFAKRADLAPRARQAGGALVAGAREARGVVSVLRRALASKSLPTSGRSPRQLTANTLKSLVGATGIEPVTPTMST